MDHKESLEKFQRFENMRSTINLKIKNVKSTKMHAQIWKLNNILKQLMGLEEIVMEIMNTEN